MNEEIVDDEEMLNIVNEIKTFIKEDRYNKISLTDLRKDYPAEIEKLEATLLNYIAEKDLIILRTEFPDKCKYFV